MIKMQNSRGKIAAATVLALATLVLSGALPPMAPDVRAQQDDGRPVIKIPRASGRDLFQNCVLCHKYDGRGGPSEGGYGADLRRTTLTRDQIINVITWGRQARGMPPFKDLLEASKIETLADFILNDLRLKE